MYQIKIEYVDNDEGMPKIESVLLDTQYENLTDLMDLVVHQGDELYDLASGLIKVTVVDEEGIDWFTRRFGTP